jgi:excisionase family DNA binding protein
MCNISQAESVMNSLLTARDVQQLLQVDRSTVYRMAEDGRLPAVKVGKQWRFPADRLQQWLGPEVGMLLETAVSPETADAARFIEGSQLASMLPLECVQMIQDSHAGLLGVMLVITDIEGNPVTEPSNPCGLFAAASRQPNVVRRCVSSWRELGQALNIEPVFRRSHLGLLCARGLIRVGRELPGMVVAGCVAPDDWPPSAQELRAMAEEFGVEPSLLAAQLDEVYFLSEDQRARVLSSVQQVANIVAHIVRERMSLLARLDGIADLARV